MVYKKSIVRPFQKRIFYTTCAVLWLSGMLWLYVEYFAQIQSEFGPQTNPAQAELLKVHGVATMVFLLILGTMLFHIPIGWRQKRNIFSGESLLVTCGILILTGWGLYYVGHEDLRKCMAMVHWILGAFLPFFIIFHIWKIVHQRSKLLKHQKR